MATSPTFKRILVAVDFDEPSAGALRTGAVIAEAFGAELTVLHAASIEMPPYFTDAQAETLEGERLDARARCVLELNAFARKHTNAPVTATVEEGPPADVILRLAPGFDLIVVGTHRRRAPSRWWLGSVAEAVVRAAPVPVLVVPLERSAS